MDEKNILDLLRHAGFSDDVKFMRKKSLLSFIKNKINYDVYSDESIKGSIVVYKCPPLGTNDNIYIISLYIPISFNRRKVFEKTYSERGILTNEPYFEIKNYFSWVREINNL